MLNRFVQLLGTGVIIFTGSIQAEDIVQSIAPPSVIFEALALNHDIGTKQKPRYRSPVALVPAPDGRKIYIAEQTAKRIAVYNLETGSLEKPILLPNEVTGLAISSDGTMLFATCASEQWPDGMVCVISPASGRILCSISEGIGNYPCSPVLSPDNLRLYVCNRFSNSISVVMLSGCRVSTVMKAGREPYAAALTSDGKKLLVGNYLPACRSNDTAGVASTVTVFDTDHYSILATIPLPDGSTALSGIAVSPDGMYAFVTNTVGRYRLVGSTVTSGWLHTNNLGVIDLSANSFISNVCLDVEKQGMANPWSIRYAADNNPPDSAFLLISHAGNSAISVISVKPFMGKVQDAAASGIDLQRDFTALSGCRTVITTGLDGCRSFATIGRRLFAAGFFDDNRPVMEEYTFGTGDSALNVGDAVLHTIGTPVRQTGERLGEQIFYSAKICMQQWQSCHSCHPAARVDGLNWILNSGVAGTPKNTKSMLYAWWTPPTMWVGRWHAQNTIVSAIELELFVQSAESLSLPLYSFFMYMQPVPSPYREKGCLSPSAQRGKFLYYNKDNINCIICHKGPLFVDDKLYNVGVFDPDDQSSVNTPGLVESWRTAPYGHIGSYTDIREIMALEEHSDIRKKTADGVITEQDIQDLVQYVLSL